MFDFTAAVDRRDREIARARREAEIRTAADYMRQHPDMTRDEALRLAAKHVAKDFT